VFYPRFATPTLFHIAQQSPRGTTTPVQNILLFAPAATAF